MTALEPPVDWHFSGVLWCQADTRQGYLLSKRLITGSSAVFELSFAATGPITNHVNCVRTPEGQFAYVNADGSNEVQAFRTCDFRKVATVAVGSLLHGIWPSGNGSRVYVGLENDDGLAVTDTATYRLIATVAIGQAPQAVV